MNERSGSIRKRVWLARLVHLGRVVERLCMFTDWIWEKRLLAGTPFRPRPHAGTREKQL